VDCLAPATAKFVTAVRRRILLARIAESIAIALAIASFLGLILMPILLWRGDSGLPLAQAMFALGLACGLVWGISRRPTRFEAALEADRQLDLNDLLGTVVQFNRPADAWTELIASISDARCRSLRPSAVIVNRLGLRAWGGVGVLGALLFTFALFTARPADVSAASPLASATPNSAPIAPLNSPDQTARPNSRPPGPGGVDDNANRDFEQATPVDSATTGDSNADHSANPGTSPATGGGTAITRQMASQHDFPATPQSSGNSSQSGLAAAGIGRPDSRAAAPGDSASNLASPPVDIAHRVPPWQSGDWTGAADAAQTAINSGRVPDSDADLVRDYFQRD
jgi:hypothetical protein